MTPEGGTLPNHAVAPLNRAFLIGAMVPPWGPGQQQTGTRLGTAQAPFNDLDRWLVNMSFPQWHLRAQFFFNKTGQGFPGGAVVESPPADGCRGHGFVPRSGKIPHAAERVGP